MESPPAADSRPASTLAPTAGAGEPPKGKGSAFWLTFTAVCMSVFLSALDLTAVGTALPTITAALDGGDEFSWVGSAYALSSTAFLPLSGHLADAFGRRPIMLGSILVFAVGSALSGAAQNMNMLIAARTLQGVGGGGILNLTEIIVSDLVPLAERGMFQGYLGLVWALASGVGPPIGGAFAKGSTWRWLFYMNLPLCGIAFALVAIFLRVRTPPGSVLSKLARIDWFGNFLVVAGATMAMTGLTFGGIRFPWTSAQVLVPLILGLATLAGFFVYEARVPEEPSIPWEVVNNRTSLAGYVGTFVHGLTSISAIYYVPVYFQAVMGASPIRSGVQILPLALTIAFFALVGGGSVQGLGKYRPTNIAGWLFIIVGFGVLSLMKANISSSQWIGYQILVSAGFGLLYPAPVFPVLAPLPVERTASALAFFAFVRSFAQSWGITISATILQNELKKKLPADFVSLFPGGVEIAYAAIPVVKTLPEPLKNEVRVAFADSMITIWHTMIGISALGVISVFFMEEIDMRVTMDDRFGLTDGEIKDEEKSGADVRVGSSSEKA
jgi:MFS family permease